MLDRFAYIAMGGATQAVNKQSIITNNLANVNTNGFKAQLHATRATQAYGFGAPTRTFTAETTPGTDFTPGSIQTTGRDLDIALQGKGWLSIKAGDGSEAYSRDGNLNIGNDGTLQNSKGHQILGEGGAIRIPANNVIKFGDDGTITSYNPVDTNQIAVVGKLKLVNPQENLLERSPDGYFRLINGGTANADNNVKITSRAVETSNVSMVEGLVDMISSAKKYDAQVKLLQTAEQNSKSTSQLLTLN